MSPSCPARPPRRPCARPRVRPFARPAARAFALLLAAALAGSCGGEGATSPPVPEAIAAVSPTVFTATAGLAVPDAQRPRVRVTDSKGRGVKGVPVVFTVRTGGGTIGGGVVPTDAEGIAALPSWTLGRSVGENTLTASAADVLLTTFTATGEPGAPARVGFVTSTLPAQRSGEPVSEPLVAQLYDAFDNPTRGAAPVPVTLVSATAAARFVGVTTVATDSLGLARFDGAVMRGQAGDRAIQVTAPGLLTGFSVVPLRAGRPVRAAAHDTPLDRTAPPNAHTRGVGVRAFDADSNPVPGAAVSYAVTGGGRTSIASGLTDSWGLATVQSWVLGPEEGPQELTVTIPPAAPVVFRAQGVIGTPQALGIVQAGPGVWRAGVRPAPDSMPVLVVTDTARNPVRVAGIAVQVACIPACVAEGTVEVVTDSTGTARFTDLRLRGRADAVALQYRVPALSAWPLHTTGVLLAPGLPARMAIARGDAQFALPGVPVRSVPAIRVHDLDSNLVVGTAIAFTPLTTGSGVADTVAFTNTAGEAGPGRWTVGPALGRHALRATALEAPAVSVEFAAEAVASLVDVTGVDATPMRPGRSVVVHGSGFSAVPAENVVTIEGRPATVTAASATALTVTVPEMECGGTRWAPVRVEVGGVFHEVPHPLLSAEPVAMALGSTRLLTADEMRCALLPSDATARVVLGLSNGQRTYDATGAAYRIAMTPVAALGPAPVALRGAEGVLTPESQAALRLAPPRPASAPAPASATVPLLARASTPPATRAWLPGSGGRTRSRAPHAALLERNLAILARGGRQWAGARAGAQAGPALPVTYAVGDTVAIRMPDIEGPDLCGQYQPITGRVAWVGTHAVIVEDRANALAFAIDSTWSTIGLEYDALMRELLLTHFGDPTANDAVLDGNGRIVMVFSDKVRAAYGGAIAGFVAACDFFPRSTYPASNVGEYFYAQPPYAEGQLGQVGTPGTWRWLMRSTVVHEVKHIISFSERLARNGGTVFEEPWLEESTAQLAEELYERRRYNAAQRANLPYGSSATYTLLWCGIRACLGQPLGLYPVFDELAYYWYSSPHSYSPIGRLDGSDFSFYSTGWSLLRWAIDAQEGRAEAEVLRALTQSATATGVDNLEAVLGVPFAELIPQWTMALQADEMSAVRPADAPRFPSWDLRSVYTGLNADLGAPWGAWPGRPLRRPRETGAIATGAVRAGGAAFFELTHETWRGPGPQVLIRVEAPGGGAPDPALRLMLHLSSQ